MYAWCAQTLGIRRREFLRWPRSWHSRELHGGRVRGKLAWQPNQFAPTAVGCPVCSTSRGQPPTWCDLWRCREMMTKLHFERVRRGIPGPTPSTGTNPTTGRGVSPRHPGRRLPPNFYTTGTNPRTGHHWTACLCPVIRRRRRHGKSPQRKSKGGNGGGVSAYLWRCPGETVSCGAPHLYPTRPPLVLCLGFFWPLVTTGAIPRTGFQVSPRGFLVLSR